VAAQIGAGKTLEEILASSRRRMGGWRKVGDGVSESNGKRDGFSSTEGLMRRRKAAKRILLEHAMN
jgi:hypothetical protein